MSQSSPLFPDCFYRVTIKGLFVRDGKLLLVREAKNTYGQKWELPGGGLNFGEDIETSFQREIQEEMGLEVTKMSKTPVYTWTWKYENRRGVDWFYSCVLAYRVEFADLHIRPSEECEAIEFFDVAGLGQLGLTGQMTPLPDIFNPADFTDTF